MASSLAQLRGIDRDAAFEHGDGGVVVLAIHVELRADCTYRGLARLHEEGARRILRDLEERLAIVELHAA